MTADTKPNLDLPAGDDDIKTLPSWAYLLIFIFSATVVGLFGYNNAKAATKRQVMQENNPYVLQASEWMREAATMPNTPERQVFISELGVAMSDGEISDTENATLSIDYEVLISSRI